MCATADLMLTRSWLITEFFVMQSWIDETIPGQVEAGSMKRM